MLQSGIQLIGQALGITLNNPPVVQHQACLRSGKAR